MSAIKIRPAESRDADQVSKLCRRAFWNDELFADTMHPYKEQFPDDFANYFRLKFLKTVGDPSKRPIVATLRDENGVEIVTGLALWERQSSNDESSSLPSSHSSQQPENRAADPSKLDVLDRVADLIKHYWSGSRADNYYLDLLGVDPNYQGKGVGKMLTMEGIKMAKQDRVCASLISSLAGRPLYLSCGFKDIGWATEGPENPLRHLSSGQIMSFEDHL